MSNLDITTLETVEKYNFHITELQNNLEDMKLSDTPSLFYDIQEVLLKLRNFYSHKEKGKTLGLQKKVYEAYTLMNEKIVNEMRVKNGE